MEDAQRFILASHSTFESTLTVLACAVVVLGFGVVPLFIVVPLLRRRREIAVPPPPPSAGHVTQANGPKRRLWIDQRLTRGDVLWAGPTLAALTAIVLLTEGPRALTLHRDWIDLEYRLPWRDHSLRLSTISRVELVERSRRRKGQRRTWPALIIVHAADRYDVMGSSARYHDAVRAAHAEIHRRWEQTIGNAP